MAVKGDNLALPFPDNTFDLVFNSGVIEHYKYPLNVQQLKEMARVTKPKGEVIVSVPNSLCLWYEAVKTVLTFFDKWPFGYEEGYTPWKLERSVREAELEPVEITGFLCMPPLATHDREMLPFNLRRKIALFEKHLPFKEFYCYSVCVSCRKP